MSVSLFSFTELPTELLEQILSHLPGQGIIKMEAVSRRFADLVRGSSILQYHRELFSAGLIDNPHHPCNLVERRKLCKGYVDKWIGKLEVAKRTYHISGDYQAIFSRVVALGGDLLVLNRPYAWGYYHFLRVPPGVSQQPVWGWRLPPFPFNVLGSAVYPPADLFVVAEVVEKTVYIHLLKLQDGSVYGTPPSGRIAYKPPSGTPIAGFWLGVTRSRVMARIFGSDDTEEIIEVVAVWDVKTGDLVLEVPSHRIISRLAFLDEFRIIASRYHRSASTSYLVVFDTRTPQNHPEGFQRFGLPPRYRCGLVNVRVDCDRPLGMVTREEPFTVDPAQAVFVLEFPLTDESNTRVLLAMRTNALIGRTGSDIPWEAWGGGSVVAEIPLDGKRMATFVHGAQVMVVMTGDRGYCHLYTFDLSKWGCHALPLWGGEGGVGERRFSLVDGGDVLLEGIRSVGVDPKNMGLLGNGIVIYPDPVEWGVPDGGTILRIWELVCLPSRD